MADRPRIYKCEGIVLRRRNIGEADSVFTVFSASEGKFDAVARGVRKARSHMRGHLEPLTRSRFLVARGRSLDVFTQAETISPYRAVRDDLELGAAAMYVAELTDRFTADRQENIDLYGLLVALFEALDSAMPTHVVRIFELELLRLMGYEVQLDQCAICGRRIIEDDTLLSPASGGLVCADCRARAGGGRILSVRAIKVLRYARSASFSDFAALRLDPGLGRQLQLMLGEVIRFVLEREVNSGRFVDQVARLGPSVALTGDDVQ